MLTPIQNVLTTLLSSGVALVPALVGIAIFIAGVTLAFGNHQHGKMGVAMALVGGAVMLGAQTMASSVHA